MASAMHGSSSTINTRTLTAWYDPGHIVGVSKSAYLLATPGRIELGSDRQRTSASYQVKQALESDTLMNRGCCSDDSSVRRTGG